MGKDCVEPYSEGRNAWLNSKISFLLRIRGIAFSIAVSIIFLTSKPFWWDSIPIPHKQIAIDNIIVTSIGLSFIALIMGIIYLRKRTIRSLDVKYLLHQFTHDIRDAHSQLFRKIANKNPSNLAQNYQNHLKLVIDYSKDYFRKITNDNTIEAALRLATPHKEEQGNILYKTVTRTNGLNKNRENTSELIAANKGLPRYLIETNKQRKVLIYNDLEKAIKLGVFKKTKSEEEFPKEISTMMVAPLNAWDGKKNSMIGILYITSRNKKTFAEKNVDSMRFIADKISDTISISTEINKIILKNRRKKSA